MLTDPKMKGLGILRIIDRDTFASTPTEYLFHGPAAFGAAFHLGHNYWFKKVERKRISLVLAKKPGLFYKWDISMKQE